METKSKKVKVIMLPTNNKDINIPILSPSGHLAFIQSNENGIRKGWYRTDEFHKQAKFADNGSENWKPQHLYFISDEEIKEGEFYINMYDSTIYNLVSSVNGKGMKIIASNDESLNLPKPSKSFIEKYCKLGGIDEVMVEYVRDLESMQLNINSKGKISSWYLKTNSHNEIKITSIKDSWNREEIEELNDLYLSIIHKDFYVMKEKDIYKRINKILE